MQHLCFQTCLTDGKFKLTWTTSFLNICGHKNKERAVAAAVVVVDVFDDVGLPSATNNTSSSNNIICAHRRRCVPTYIPTYSRY